MSKPLRCGAKPQNIPHSLCVCVCVYVWVCESVWVCVFFQHTNESIQFDFSLFKNGKKAEFQKLVECPEMLWSPQIIRPLVDRAAGQRRTWPLASKAFSAGIWGMLSRELGERVEAGGENNTSLPFLLLSLSPLLSLCLPLPPFLSRSRCLSFSCSLTAAVPKLC